jgi:hypothetical protein
MPRKPMASVVGMPQHDIQRGNNWQVIFAGDVEEVEVLRGKRLKEGSRGRPFR